MSNLRLGRQISPFETCKADIAVTLLMCYEAINRLHDAWLQPQHWDHEPTREELQELREYEETVEDARLEVNRLANEIYMALTGKYPSNTGEYPNAEDIPF